MKECKFKKKNFDSSTKESSDDDPNALFISANTNSNNAWLIDSGFSYHITPHKEWFATYKAYDAREVFLGDNNSKKVVDKGKVKLCFSDGRIKTLDNV